MPTLDITVFDAPLQTVRMGELDGDRVHLRYAGEQQTTAIALTAQERLLLRGLDPTASTRVYGQHEKQALLSLAARDIVRIVTPGSGLDGYSWALDITVPLHTFRAPFEPGFICVAGDRSFNLVDLGRPLLDRMDGVRTVGEVTGEIQQEVLSGPDGRRVLADARERTGRPYYDLLCDAGMSLTKGILDTAAGVALPSRREDTVVAGTLSTAA